MNETVTIISEPLAITVFDDTPIVTIIDNNTGKVTVADDTPQVTIIQDQPTKVIVNTGIGGFYDQDAVLAILEGQITTTSLGIELVEDISHVRNLWAALGNQIVLLYQDGVALEAAMTSYTDTKIASMVVNLNVIDDRVNLAFSEINQESDRIDLNVAHLLTTNDRVTVTEGRLTITEDNINSTVSRLDSIDNPVTGFLSSLESQINQNADNITLSVASIDQNNTDIIENTTNLAITNGNLTSYASRLSTVEGTISSTTQTLTAVSATTSIQQVNIDNNGYAIGAVENMLSNKWGVEVTESVGGVPYITSMGLFLHPDWLNYKSYVVDDYVYFFDSGVGGVYRCLVNHVASTINNPAGAQGSTYWVADKGKKSSFVVLAEEFKVITDQDTLTSVFSVVDDVVTINGSLLVSKIESNDYEEGVSGFIIDPENSNMELNHVKLTLNWAEDVEGENLPDVTGDHTALNVKNVGEYTAEDIATWSNDPAARVNAGTTTIHGGIIETDTILAGSMHVTQLSAISADMGMIKTGTIRLGEVSKYMYVGSYGSYRGIFLNGTGSGHFRNDTDEWFRVNCTSTGGQIGSEHGISFHVGGKLNLYGDVVATGNIQAHNITEMVDADGTASNPTTWTTIATLSDIGDDTYGVFLAATVTFSQKDYDYTGTGAARIRRGTTTLVSSTATLPDNSVDATTLKGGMTLVYMDDTGTDETYTLEVIDNSGSIVRTSGYVGRLIAQGLKR